MNIFSILKSIVQHPLNKHNKWSAILRFFNWQTNTKLNPYPIIYQFTAKAKLIVAKGMTGATGNLYNGLHEYNDMFFLLHFLRPNDLFYDVGANVGSYTVLASAHVGATTVAIEPVPAAIAAINNNVAINHTQHLVTVLNAAVGATQGTIQFTKSLDTVNHVALATETDVIQVPINTIDALTINGMPILLKIDVEGYETEVINGAIQSLSHTQVKAIIIELNGSGTRYGYNEKLIHTQLLTLGFLPYQYTPTTRSLLSVTNFGTHNTIYIRDYEFVLQRVQSAQAITILNQSI